MKRSIRVTLSKQQVKKDKKEEMEETTRSKKFVLLSEFRNPWKVNLSSREFNDERANERRERQKGGSLRVNYLTVHIFIAYI